MGLKIKKASDPVEVKQIVCTIYGPPGHGKSTLGFTAVKPLLLDFDKGVHRAGNRGDSVQISSWADVAGMTATDLAPYSTLVIDTAGRALDVLSLDIIEQNPKMGRGCALTLQGFGELKSRFLAWKNLIHSFGLDLVLICHMDEQRKGDELIERLDIQGASRNEIYKSADAMGRLYLSRGKRWLNFSPSDTAFGKNPAQLPALEVPHFAQSPNFLGEVLAHIKAELNKQSEQQKHVASLLSQWKVIIDEAATVDEFNKLIPETQQADERVRDNVKRLLTSTAKKKGIEFDRKAGSFVAKTAAAV
jgi:hypothetical protein